MAYPAETKIGILFFTGPAGTGWSEVYTFADSDYLTGWAALLGIIDTRLPLMTPNWAINYARLSDPNIAGDALIDSEVRPGTYATSSEESLPASAALLIRQTNGDYHSSFRYLHALPEVINDDGVLVTGGLAEPWFDALATYLEELETVTVMPKLNKMTGNYELNSILTAQYVRITNHRVGRPFGLSRGRRSRQCPPAVT